MPSNEMTLPSEGDIIRRKPENIGVYTNPQHELYLRSTPRPVPGPGQCLIHIRATGVCGSDVHFWKKGHIGDMVVTGENRLGHESAGVVIEVGNGVKRIKRGDRVALECGIPCMRATCKNCREGRYNACPEVLFFSTPPYHGTFARYHVHPEDWLHVLPDHLSYEEGSLLEPLSVALTAIDRSNLRLGDPTLICGAGPIGLVSLLSAHAAGANPIAIVDIDEDRLQVAKKLIPRVRTILATSDDEPRQIAGRVIDALGAQVRVALECTGVESSVQAAIYSCQFGGLVFVIGCGKDFQNLPFSHMSGNEIDLKFQYRYKNIYPKAIGLVASGVIDVKGLVTHRFSLEDGEKAFKTASDPRTGAIKVQVLDD